MSSYRAKVGHDRREAPLREKQRPSGRPADGLLLTLRGRIRCSAARWRHLRYERLEDRTLLTAAPFYLPPQYELFEPDRFLTAPQAGDPLEIALNYLHARAADLGLGQSDLDGLKVTDRYVSEGIDSTHIYLRQTVAGLDVANANLGIHVSRQGEVVSVVGGFVPGLAARFAAGELPLTPVLSAAQAVRSAATALDIAADCDLTAIPEGSPGSLPNEYLVAAPCISQDDIPARLQFVPTDDGSAALSWQLIVRTLDDTHWYNVSLDAEGGELVARTDWVSPETYTVLPIPVESPNHGAFATVVDPSAAAGAASPFGWHDTNGVAGAEFTDTRGNNVDAHLDRDGNNAPDAGSRPDGGPGLNFDFPFDATKTPLENAAPAVTNLFYWNNILHDVHYLYGFTPAAGNFQANNYGQGGVGNDAVQADAQDNAIGGSINNANFATPPEGIAPRMQMYEFVNTTPRRDSDMDAGVIIHEYGHGVSNRLTGGPANADALDALQSGGMGEGWGDWWGLMLTQQSAAATTEPHGVGTYLLGESAAGDGIRAYRYDFDITNPSLETFLAYGTGSGRSTEVHWSGTLWASALWDLNHLLIQKYGFEPNVYASTSDAGNIRALHLVMTALKLQPANPTFLQARDAILLADRLLYGGVNRDEIWTAFARRGLGEFATTTSANSTVLTTSFAAPGLTISGSVPAAGDVVLAAPTSFVVNFSSAIEAASLAPADFTVNGIPADTVVLAAGDQTATFGYAVSPVSAPGAQTMSIAADAVARASDGDLNDAFTATFQFGPLDLQVASTTPSSGGIFTLPTPLTLDVQFNQAINPASVQTTDLVLSGITGATVSGVVVLPGETTARFTITGISADGTLGASIAAGAVTSALGGGTAAFSGSFIVDRSTSSLPTFWAQYPLGSLAYDPSISGIVSFVGDTDTYTIALDPGQTISVVVTSTSSTLQPTVTLLSPTGGTLGTGNASAADRNALLQTVAVSLSGTYTVRVGGLSSTTGNYTVHAYLNSAVEAASVGIGSNNVRTSAQSLTAAFTTLSTPQATASRAAVVGSIATSMTLNAVDSGWWNTSTGHSSTNTNYLAGLVTGVEYRNFFVFDLASVTQQIATGGAQLLLTNPATGYNSPDPTETYNLFNVTTSLTTLLAGGAPNTTVFSDLGTGTNYGTRAYSAADNGQTTTIALNTSAVAALNTARGIRFALGGALSSLLGTANQFVFGGSGSSGVRQLALTLLNTDFYSFTLTAGETATLALKHLTGSGASIELQNSAGTPLAAGTPTATLDSTINNFVAPASGTYYVKVTGTSAATYNLVVTRDAAFDIEPNESFATAQPLDGAGGKNTGALGAIHAAVVPSNLAAAEGNSSNSLPFHIGSGTIQNTRYQQLYASSEFSQPGLITAVRFRRNGNTVPFASTTADMRMDLGYAATSYVSPSTTFAANRGASMTTVVDSPNVTLQTGTATASPNALDVVINLTTPFFYDPSQGDLLMDIFMRSDPTTTFFDSSFSGQHSTTRRVYTNTTSGVNATVGVLDSTFTGLVTGFDIDTITGDDWYSFDVANTVNGLRLETSTPADGPNQFANNLNPRIDLYDPSGAWVMSGSPLPDGDNEFIQYQPTTTGTYRVRVSGQNLSAGEYFLSKVNAPRVVAASLAPGAVLSPGALSVQVTFSEAMKVGNLSTGDFSLRGNFHGVDYSPASFSFDGTGTVLTLDYANLPEDNYSLTLFSGVSGGANFTNPAGDPLDGEFSGVFPSGNGAGGGNFVLSFNIDPGVEAYPAPLAPKLPLGSLIYDPSLTRTIAFAGDSDSFTLAADQHQTISVLVTPTVGSLLPVMELRDPADDLVGTAAAAPGEPALLNLAPAAGGGTYRIDVSGAGGTTGRYTIQVVLNAAIESEFSTATTNASIDNAQDIDGSALDLGNGAARLAALGTTGALLPHSSEDFETGELPASFTTYSSDPGGRVRVAAPGGTGNSSAFALLLDRDPSGPLTLNEAVYHVDLSGIAAATLSFSHTIFNDEANLLPQEFSGHFDGDGVSISDDGVRWWTILNAPTNTTWTTFSVDLAAAAAAAGMNLGAGFQIKFQQYDDFPINTDGRGFDDIRLVVGDAADTYRFTLAPGETAAVAATALAAGNLDLELRDGGDAIVATGTVGATNVTKSIAGFTALTGGTYYARISGGSVPYTLVVTKNAAFEAEQNDAFAAAQNISNTRGVLGNVETTFDLSGPIVTGPVILSGSRITLGFNADGSFITAFGGTGIQYNGVEFVSPGSPVASFSVAYNGLTFTNNAANGISQITGITRQDISSGDFLGMRIAGVAGGTVQVERIVMFRQNDDYVTIATRLTNLTGAGLTGVATLENIDPDQDFGLGTFATLNDVVAGGQLVRASGPVSGLTVGMGSVDARSTVSAEGFANFNPFDIINSPVDPDGIAEDGAIAQAFNFGSLDAGGQVSGTAVMVFGATAAAADAAFAAHSGGVTVDTEDWYSIDISATAPNLRLETSTPADGPHQFLNVLDPHLELYDPQGTLVAFGAALGDGRNETLTYHAAGLVPGVYRVRVSGDSETAGEYFLAAQALPNQRASAANDAAATKEDFATVIDVLANDFDSDGAIDPATVEIVASPSHGSVVIHPVTGKVTYQPAPNFNGSDSFTYLVRDDNGAASNVASVQVTVQAVNDVTGFDVQHGATQRSFIRYLDLVFENTDDLDEILSPSRTQLTRFDLDGVSNPTALSLAGVVSHASGSNQLNFNFGAQGIGGNRNTIAGDGYYVLAIDTDGDGILESTRAFYRLFGDADGNRVVNDADGNLIFAAYGTSGPNLNEDINGDGVVNAIDRLYTLRSRGRKLADGLWLDD